MLRATENCFNPQDERNIGPAREKVQILILCRANEARAER